MRVVALLVVVCGCLAQARHGTDAAGADGPAVVDVAAETTETADASGTCLLLSSTCPNKEGCYPFPFEGTPSGATRCAFQGVSAPSVPCQSQVECDAMSICSAPGEPDSVCLQRCSLANPRCPIGSVCMPFASYADVGVCSL